MLDAYRELRLPDDLPAREPPGDGRSVGFLRRRVQGPALHVRGRLAERRSAQTAMYVIADGLVRLLAPILPMTADELWRHLPGKRDVSVHIAEFPAAARSTPCSTPTSPTAGSVSRPSATSSTSRSRQSARTRPSARRSARASACAPEARRLALLERYRDDLPMLFIVSQVELRTRRGRRRSTRGRGHAGRRAINARAAGASSTSSRGRRNRRPV